MEMKGVSMRMEYAENKRTRTAEFGNGAAGEGKVPLFVPLYAQLSQKYLSKVCNEWFTKEFQFGEKKAKLFGDTEKNRTKQRKTTKEKGHRRKKNHEKGKYLCPPISSFGAPRLVARRMHRRGAAMRRGNRWFLTEYDNGYTVFQFELKNKGGESNGSAKKRRHLEKNERKNNGSDAQLDFPSQIFTLPEPFRGTDHSVGRAQGDETFFYQLASEDRIQSVHLGSGKRLSKFIYAAKFPLYGFSFAFPSVRFGRLSSFFSSVDLEFDQSALWALFRRPNLSDPSGLPFPHLTVLKMTSDSLKELAQWEIVGTKAERMVNAFVSCGQLFGVMRHPKQREDSNSHPLQIVSLFDFRNGQMLAGTALPISAPGWTAAGPNSISNVQYDAESDSVIVFDDGNVYTMEIHRRKATQKH
ncbi:hypothetical protein niasHT_022582 [Heterodera trifolii]|uniref:Olfactomedin-like domain-containing protein n=1 Tax=Heterodera trifolii TaxID=157864 RepID=A0ABD2JR72_9BILA